MGAFAYSPQEGTRATQYEDDVDDAVKQDRLSEIVELQRSISAERLERFVGREVDVLVDGLEQENGIKAGRVQWQADDVDGITYLERGGGGGPRGLFPPRPHPPRGPQFSRGPRGRRRPGGRSGQSAGRLFSSRAAKARSCTTSTARATSTTSAPGAR